MDAGVNRPAKSGVMMGPLFARALLTPKADHPRDLRSPHCGPPPQAQVEVMNLADLRGQALPGSLQRQMSGGGPGRDARGGGRRADDAPLSARSGRSEARSEGGRSCRSEAEMRSAVQWCRHFCRA